MYLGFCMVYLYFQSSGHTNIRSDVSYANNKNAVLGSTFTSMRSIVVSEIALYSTNIYVGNIQDMSFKQVDKGPSWLNKYDKHLLNTMETSGQTFKNN